MPPEDRKAQLTRQWLAKAERDLLAAERAINGEPPLRDVAAFHLQQAAEKALKAYLTWHDRVFRRTHDLPYLNDICVSVDPSFSQVRDAADLLTPYSTEFRYPGDTEEPSPEAIDVAKVAAEKVARFVRERLLLAQEQEKV